MILLIKIYTNNFTSQSTEEKECKNNFTSRQQIALIFFYPYSLSCYHPHLFTDENNSLSTAIPDKPISLKLFIKLCEQRRKFPVLYKLEFQTAVKVETNSCKHANRRNNLEKNQNQKCIPYDYNRVVLEKIPGVADSDYINASYVDVRNLFSHLIVNNSILVGSFY